MPDQPSAAHPDDRVQDGDVKPWSRLFPRGVPQTYAVPDVRLDRLLDDAAQDFPHSIAIVHRGRRLTWRQVQDQVDRFATVLAGLGVGDRAGVLIALPRTPQAVVALFAVWRLHATAVVMDADSEPEAMAGTASSRGCTAVVVEDRRSTVADHLPHTISTVTTGPEDVLPFPRNLTETLRRRVRRQSPLPVRMMDLVRRHPPLTLEVAASDPAFPEVAVAFAVRDDYQQYSHAQLVTAAFHLRLWMPDVVAGSERMLSTLPMHLPVGLTAVVSMPTLAAATIVLVRTQDAKQLARDVDKHDPTIIVTGHDPRPAALLTGRTPSLRVCLAAGACEPVDAAGIEQRTGARLRGWWAPSDSAGIAVAGPVYGVTKRGTVGIPVTDTSVVVVNADGRPAPPGRPGELWIDGPQLCTPGRVHTGVVGSMDTDGFVTLSGADDRGAGQAWSPATD